MPQTKRIAGAALALAFLAGCAAHRAKTPQPATVASVPNLPSPAPLGPADQSQFTNYPRTVHFQWSRVPQAATYAIEIDCFGCCMPGKWCSDAQGTGYVVGRLPQSTYTFNFWGDQQGRWRIWAVDAQGNAGTKTPWWRFSFKTPRPDQQSKPSPFGGPAPRRFRLLPMD